jgi:RimJ/RimL family protein N-acetyltransferase
MDLRCSRPAGDLRAASGGPSPSGRSAPKGPRLAREAWGFGYATEAASAVVRDGFDRVGLAEILASTVPPNVRSRRVMEKLGMRHHPAEDFDHPRLPEGHALRRHVLYRLERSWMPAAQSLRRERGVR